MYQCFYLKIWIWDNLVMYHCVDVILVAFVALPRSEVYSINNFESVLILHK
ncbi:hypothetical protein LV92_01690 [Arenibacter echinorum]|uniref:Uncharacterized protein n=1 Tax=Arenibacter echinorum TaxID=440515 RepID=A0A327R8F7_9FLAO|nr:hypothetical protein LV92_01690 [Arenibacter echinorum]